MVGDLDAIQQLKARYFRLMDTKDWAGFRQVFTDDVVIDTSESDGDVMTGADAFVAFIEQVLGDAVTVHQGHMPEIELTSDATATGTWAMQDLITWPDGMQLVGFGHYHDTYVKGPDGWRIATSKLTRLRRDLTVPEEA
jgi:uncharacterized protein (TIGR02246 family)